MSEQFGSKITYPFMMIPNKLWELGLTPIEQSVLNRIIFRAGREGDCFESRESMAKACGISVRSVSNALDALEQCKVISVICRKLEGKTNLISVNEPAQWISKLQMVQKQEVRYAPDADLGMHEVQTRYARGAHRTILPELNSIEQDSFFNTIASDSVAASHEVIEPEVLDDRLPKESANKKEGQTTALATSEASTTKSSSSPTMNAWQAYSEAFQAKYRVEPQRNARVMGQLKKFVEFVGMLDAPDILRFYLTCNDQWYVKNMHSVGIALSQAEKLAAGFRGARVFTAKEAQQIDSMQTSQNYVNDYIRTREAHRNAQNRDD